MRKIGYWPGWKSILPYFRELHHTWGADQEILQRVVYPLFSRYDDICVHASFNRFEPNAREMPPFDDTYHFVGEYCHYNGDRNLDHINILVGNLGSPTPAWANDPKGPTPPFN